MCPPNSSHQMIELEPMKAEDYEAFLSDPSGYMMRSYLPRIFESAAPMAKLPPFRSLVGPWGMPSFLAQFTRPDMAAMLEKFRKAAELQAEWQSRDINFDEEMAGLGFPSYTAPGMMAPAPFDMISDFLRGMRGAMLDMYRLPDKLLEACDMLCKQSNRHDKGIARSRRRQRQAGFHGASQRIRRIHVSAAIRKILLADSQESPIGLNRRRMDAMPILRRDMGRTP